MMKASIMNPFVWKTAWRDSRTERRKLLLFASAIIMGVAALVSVNSFGENLIREVDNQAKSLLGADIVLNSRRPFTERIDLLADSIGAEQSLETSFTSMALFPQSGGTRLVQVRALKGDFPFYGEFETEPIGALVTLRTSGYALVDEGLMIQYNVSVGDTVKIGNRRLVIAASILGIPGESAAASLVGPRIYMALDDLESTELLQTGSIASWRRYWKLSNPGATEETIESIRPILRKERVTIDTVEERRQGVNAVVGNVTRFLNVIGYLALLLGAVGIASSIHVYTRRKLGTVAILRCLGLSAWQSLSIFLIQTMFFGFIGTIIGIAFGIAIQLIFPWVMGDFLPVDVEFMVSWRAIIEGLVTGFIVTAIFSLLPLLGVRSVSPLSVLRSGSDESHASRDPASIFLLVVGVLAMIGFAVMQTGNWYQGLILSLSVAFAALLLTFISWGIIQSARRLNTSSWNYVWRQGLANLHRPRNQTLILVLSLGLGATLIMTQVAIQHNLLAQVEEVGAEGQPNMILFDVQIDQLDGVKKIVIDNGLPVLFQVPVVTMRLTQINGRSVESISRDSTNTIPRWALSREYRSTYRSELVETEKLLSGSITPTWKTGDGAIPISLEEDIARDLGVSLGDSITIDVQGVPMKTLVGSIRKVDWQRVQPNFFIVFPDGPLNQAPQFLVLVTRTENREESALVQRTIVENFPNVSAVDLELILATVRNILDQAAFIIRFMAIFSIATGLIVLTGSVIVSKFQRMRENVLLRTIGASRKQITGILMAEYTFLATFASLAGLLLAVAAGWALTLFVFQSTFSMPWIQFGIGWVLLTSLTLIIAIMNSRGTLNRPPLEVLRNET
jgi:putative ABC transport system permease protein